MGEKKKRDKKHHGRKMKRENAEITIKGQENSRQNKEERSQADG